jgi:hypothetical protein
MTAFISGEVLQSCADGALAAIITAGVPLGSVRGSVIKLPID